MLYLQGTYTLVNTPIQLVSNEDDERKLRSMKGYWIVEASMCDQDDQKLGCLYLELNIEDQKRKRNKGKK